MAILSEATVFNLKSSAPSVGDVAILLGYNSPGDGGGGTFYWDSSSGLTDNGGTIFQLSPPTAGRWIRIYSGPINVKWFGATGNGATDDTVAINNALSAATSGEVIFGYGATYLTGTLTAPKTLTIGAPLCVNLNNCTIQFNAASNDSVFNVTSDNVTIKNGTIQGTFTPGTAPTTPPSGPFGIKNSVSGTGKGYFTVDGMTVRNFNNYGVTAPGGAFLRVINSKTVNTGNIGLSCVSVVASPPAPAVDAGIVKGNIFDRFDVPSANITQPCVDIKGNAPSNAITNLIFTGNKLFGALNPPIPANDSAAGMEIRHLNNAVICNNLTINGSLGISNALSNNVVISGNSCFGADHYCIEVVGSTNVVVSANIANGNNSGGSTGACIVFDTATEGGVNTNSTFNTACNNIILNNVVCITAAQGSNFNSISGGIVHSTLSNNFLVDLSGVHDILISGMMIVGDATFSNMSGILVDNSISTSPASNVFVNNCLFSNCLRGAVVIKEAATGALSGLRLNNNTANGTMVGFTFGSGTTITTPYYYSNSPEVIGSEIVLAGGTNACKGTATLAAGSVTASNTAVTANSILLFSVTTPGGTQGNLSYTKVAGTSFTITSSSATDTSSIAWMIIN